VVTVHNTMCYLQVKISQDVDFHSMSESLLRLHHHTTVVISLKTWLHVLNVSVIK